MGRKTAILMTLIIVISCFSAAHAAKNSARIETLGNQDIATLHAAPHFTAAERCTTNSLGDMKWLINHWLVGAELYKTYQDPGLTCTGPYPFSVEEIHMILYVNNLPCTLYVSVDVETADMTDPECPFPGDLLSLSSEYMFVLDQAGYNLYQITVPLDSVAVVDQPFFAGFYIANVVDTAIGVEMVTDSIPIPCRDYNIWDTTLGYVDLTETGFEQFPSFPGRIYMYASGTPGGSGGTQPAPVMTLLQPFNNELVTGALEVWGVETAGSDIIDSVVFAYREGGSWANIYNDNDGTQPLRNGVDPAGTGTGYYSIFDYFSLSEDIYWIKATAYDTLGRTSVDSHMVSIDPTPPDPTLTNPTGLDSICLPATLSATTEDENLDVMRFLKKDAPSYYTVPTVTLDQFDYGDNNGNPTDGNPVVLGEYGDYYAGPAAAATAIKYWFDKGFLNTMKEGQFFIPVDTVVERMADLMKTRRNGGTYDDMFFYALTEYNRTHGNSLLMNVYRNPDYIELRSMFQERENFIVLAIGGNPGTYLSLTGLNGLLNLQDQYDATVVDHAGGTSLTTGLRMNFDVLEIMYDGTWHPVDAIFSVIGGTHTVDWDLIANDANGVDSWSYNWTNSDLSDGDFAFVDAMAIDADGRTASDQSLIVYNCGSAYTVADYDGNGSVGTSDLIFLINFIYKDGPAPSGGAHRADANCDGLIDISDVIYAIQYFYNSGPAPCH